MRETWINGKSEATKNDGSLREIDLCQQSLDALLKEKERSKLSEFVFSNNRGKPLDNNNFTARIWYPLLESLNLEKRRPYQTRHTCASLWLASCENPEWIAKQLGHANSSMLFKIYSRYIPNFSRKDGSLFEKNVTHFLTTTNAIKRKL